MGSQSPLTNSKAGVVIMANIVVVQVQSDFPKSKAEWNVDVGDGTVAQQLLYTNAAYSLVAAVAAKLGILFSEMIAGDSSESDVKEAVVELSRKISG
jgi:hypothetical protein